MKIKFGMVVLIVRELPPSIDFYRLLGLEIADPMPDRPVSVSRLTDDVSLILISDELARRDPDWARPERGYQQLLEFLVQDEVTVDTQWQTLTAAGYRGRQAPARTFGPYAAIVDDPDGNVTMITADPEAAGGDPTA
jgi:predicted lactoylglutathione lyase